MASFFSSHTHSHSEAETNRRAPQRFTPDLPAHVPQPPNLSSATPRLPRLSPRGPCRYCSSWPCSPSLGPPHTLMHCKGEVWRHLLVSGGHALVFKTSKFCRHSQSPASTLGMALESPCWFQANGRSPRSNTEPCWLGWPVWAGRR